MSWLLPKRQVEGFMDSVAASGAAGWYADDPVDGDRGFRGWQQNGRPVPDWTLERSRTYSVHSYRANPMARAIVDTYTSFAVGDQGLTIECQVPEVREAAEQFWNDPRNKLGERQELLLRSHMLNGETALQVLQTSTGRTRVGYIDPMSIEGVTIAQGNVLWPESLQVRTNPATLQPFAVVWPNDLTGLRTGEALWRTDWQALATDRRGMPFLTPILDWLEGYDRTLWNLIDRTTLARYLVWDVTVRGDQAAIDKYIEARRSREPPRSGTVEFHTDSVEWNAKTAEVGSFEDSQTAQQALTSVAAGAGLAKTWLAEPENANRATSMSMAEPVRRRVGSVQSRWLSFMTEAVRYAIDQRVLAGTLPKLVTITEEAGATRRVSPSETVRVTGPEVAAADAAINATTLLNLGQGLSAMVSMGIMSLDAAKAAGRKAWEDFVGVPYRAELDNEDSADELADYLGTIAQAKAPAMPNGMSAGGQQPPDGGNRGARPAPPAAQQAS